jgi:hypothetical protein
VERTDLQRVMERKVAGVKTRWVRAPSGARYGFADETGSGGGYLLPGPSAPSWDDRPPDPAALEKAKQAGRAAMAAGYGQARADGLVPCTVCPACDAGYPEQCRHPSSKAAARHEAALAADADRVRAEVLLAELGGLYVELSAGLR